MEARIKSRGTKPFRSFHTGAGLNQKASSASAGQRPGERDVREERTATRNRFAADGGARFGRPSRTLAGEVGQRILDAAAKVFLERGFEGATDSPGQLFEQRDRLP
jgi:hypothetical protein